MARPVGRPSKYNDELLAKAREYLENWRDGDDDDKPAIPQIAALALYIDVSRETIYDWLTHEDKAEFSDVVSKLLAKQERILFDQSLQGKLNASITKLALVKHGYRDHQEVDQNTAVTVNIGGKDAGSL